MQKDLFYNCCWPINGCSLLEIRWPVRSSNLASQRHAHLALRENRRKGGLNVSNHCMVQSGSREDTLAGVRCRSKPRFRIASRSRPASHLPCSERARKKARSCIESPSGKRHWAACLNITEVSGSV